MRVKCQYSPSKKSSHDCFFVGLVGRGNMEQLRWPRPGPTLWDVERETTEQIGGVHFSTNNFVDEAYIILETSFLQTADLEMM